MEEKQARAVARHIRMSPRKARQVIDLIRGKTVSEAFAILRFTPQRAAKPVNKVLKSAVANAEHNYEMNTDKLYVKEAYVDAGPTLKRIMPRAMGRADLIRKRTSHITVVVSEKEGDK
ncbi:MAG: 50S ribosomal protein L22 [Peptococcaceae bacterium]|jgi:large subunit ribosomal protein L22|nr:50S ribosomal protein L22 [Peptococcaceae bacterium]MDH7526167.1 50S ribosomal protein L22 [Peptococcaceae bacterium]